MGQLAKTHATHPNYPNFHGIRQYRVLIIPFSAKLNVIPYRYIIQYDTRSPSQHPHSWMEFEDFLPSRHFTIAPGDIKSISKTPSIHGFFTYWWLDQYSPRKQIAQLLILNASFKAMCSLYQMKVTLIVTNTIQDHWSSCTSTKRGFSVHWTVKQ